MQEKKSVHALVSKAKEALKTSGYGENSERFIRGVWKALEKQAVSEQVELYSVAFGQSFLQKRYGIETYETLKSLFAFG